MTRTSIPTLAQTLQAFFTQRLMKQRQASPNTIKSYRDTFRLLLKFSQRNLGKLPSQLDLSDIDAPLVAAFLDEIETDRHLSARSRNARLAAIRSFFRFAALEEPAQSAQIQRVLAIPSKRHTRTLINFLTKPEMAAMLAAPDRNTWSGRRDHALILLALQTGLRLSEITGLCKTAVILEAGPHVRVIGKGRKERCVPLTKQTCAVLKSWLIELGSEIVFPGARGQKLSADGVQYIVRKHIEAAAIDCPSLKLKRVTPHVLRHTTAMQLLQSGVDRAMIALWLGHESVETTQMYLHANLEYMEQILAKTDMPDAKPGRYRPDDQLMSFLNGL